PAAASGASTAYSASELALVGPDMTWRLEPNSAATTQGTMAEYRPYSGGRPASVAKATPCGNTSKAPSRPASASARSVAGPISSTHVPNNLLASLLTRRAAPIVCISDVPGDRPAGP